MVLPLKREVSKNGGGANRLIAMFWLVQKVHQGLGKEFIIALKSNRTAALSYEAKLQGGFHRIDTLDLPEGQRCAAGCGDWTFLSCCFARS